MKAAKEKHGAKSGGYQVHAYDSPLPMDLHRMYLIPSAMTVTMRVWCFLLGKLS